MRWRGILTGLPAVAVTYAVLRALAVAGLPAARFPDSTGYLTLDLSTPIDRPFPVPLLYALAGSDTGRVALQVAAGVAAWVWLAHELSSGSRRPGTVRWATVVIGLTPQVIRFDQAILAESLTISAGVALVAATVRAAAVPRAYTTSPAWVTMLVVFTLVRPHHVLLLLAVAATVTLRSVRKRRLPGLLGMMIVLSAAFGVMQVQANKPTSNLNMYTVLSERIVTDPVRSEWFVKHGMPRIEIVENMTGYDTPEMLPSELLAYLNLPQGQMPPSLMRIGGMELARWVHDDGWSTYARWLVTHPSETWGRLTDLAGPTMDVADDGFLPLDTRTVVPRVFFVPTVVCILVTLLGAALAALRGRRRTALAAVAVLAGALTLYAVAMLTSGIEHPRHAAVAAVLVRVAALAGVAQFLAVRVRTDASSPASPGA